MTAALAKYFEDHEEDAADGRPRKQQRVELTAAPPTPSPSAAGTLGSRLQSLFAMVGGIVKRLADHRRTLPPAHTLTSATQVGKVSRDDDDSDD